MPLPLQITIRDIPATDSLTNHIKEKAEKLTKFSDKIISCHIVIEQPQKNKIHGKLYAVRIDITVPHEEIVVNKIQDENIFIAIRDAINAASRRLQGKTQKLRGEVKNHIPLTNGKIVRLFPEDDCGFIESLDGQEFYFNKDGVIHPNFDQLTIGTQVQFLKVMADEGPQANRVSAGKHREE